MSPLEMVVSDQQGVKLEVIIREIYSSLVKSESISSICSRLNVTRNYILSVMYKRGGIKPTFGRDIAIIKNVIKYYHSESEDLISRKLPQINSDFMQFLLKCNEKNISNYKNRKLKTRVHDMISVIKGPLKGRSFKVLDISNMNIHDTPKLEYVKIDVGEGIGEEYILETWVVGC